MGLLDLNYSHYLCVPFACPLSKAHLSYKNLQGHRHINTHTHIFSFIFSSSLHLPSTSSLLLLTHARSLLSPLGVFLLNNQFFEPAVNAPRTRGHARKHACTDARLETGSIPLSVLLKEALTSFLALGQTHSYPSEEERGRAGEEGK